MKSVQVSNIVYITLSTWHKKVLTRKDFELINMYNQVLAYAHFIKFYIKFAYLSSFLIMYTLCTLLKGST